MRKFMVCVAALAVVVSSSPDVHAADRSADVMFSTNAAVPFGNGATFKEIRTFDYTNGGLAINTVNSITMVGQPLWGVYSVNPATGLPTRVLDTTQLPPDFTAVTLAGFDGTNVWSDAFGRNASRQAIQRLYKGATFFASPGSTATTNRFNFMPGKNADNGEIVYQFSRGGSAQLNASGTSNVTLVGLNAPTGLGPNITSLPRAVVRDGNDSVFLAFASGQAFGGFGYFKHDRSNGSLSPIVTTSTPLPKRDGGTSTLGDLLGGLNLGNNYDYANGSIAFISSLINDFTSQSTVVFTNQDGPWQRIFERGDPAPNAAPGATLNGPQLVAKDDDTIYIMSDFRIYQYEQGTLSLLFTPGDTLNNGAISTVGYGQNWSIQNFHAENGMVMLNVRDNTGVDHIVGIHKLDPFSAPADPGLDVALDIMGGANRPGGVSVSFENLQTPGDFTGSFEQLTPAEFINAVTGAGGDPGFFLPTNGVVQAWDIDISGDPAGSISLTFGYDDTNLSVDESDLAIYHLLRDGSFEVLTGIIDEVNNTITVETDSLSPFYLGAVPEPASLALLALGGLAIVRRR